MKQYLYRALVAAVVICAVTQAAESSPGDQPAGEARENGTTHALEEIIITASRQESKAFNSSLPVNVVTREAIEKIAPTGMGDLFEHLPGLNVSHTSMGSVRPMIRGLYDERVLVMVDGIRLSEQRGGGDHALSINPGQIERIEVVRGPGSVLYGSDAIGGVINIITRNSRHERRDASGVRAELGAQYDSAANARTGDAYVEGGAGNINFFAGGIYQNTDNVSTPDGELKHSFYDVCNYSGGVNYSDENTFFGLWGYASESDIGNPLKYSFKESYFDGEKHRFATVAFERRNMASFLPKVSIDGAFQRHNRHFHMLNPSDVAIDIFLDIDTWNLQPNFTVKLGDVHRVTAGAQFFYEQISSSREMTTASMPGVIPDCTRLGTGFFVQDELFITRRLTVVLGGRYDRIVSESEPGADEIAFGHPIGETSVTDSNVSGNAGILFALIPGRLNATVNAGRAFRAPTLLERYFYGTHTEGEDRGNPDLDPEVSMNIDAGLKLNMPGFWMTVSGFRNVIDNYIVKIDTGQAGPSGAIFEFSNVDSALIYGAEAEAEIALVWGVALFGNVTWLRGENRDTEDALPYMPPLSGTYGVRYSRECRAVSFWAEGGAHSAARQDRVDATSETETAGYTVFDIRCGVDYGRTVSLTAWVKNLTDKSYHNHLSRVSHMNEQPERSIGGSVRLRI